MESIALIVSGFERYRLDLQHHFWFAAAQRLRYGQAGSGPSVCRCFRARELNAAPVGVGERRHPEAVSLLTVFAVASLAVCAHGVCWR
jgi:hypothetical protein